MKRTLSLFPALLLVVLISSCGSNKRIETASSGKTAEMLVVTNSETRWEGVVGEAIRAYFNQDYEVLPQIEPLFEMAHIPLPSFTGDKMFQAHHNILIVKIDAAAETSTIEARKNPWSKPQRVITIKSPSDEAFVDFFNKNKEAVYGVLMDSEYERLQKIFKGFRDRGIRDEVKKQFGFNLEIPSGYYIASKKADFMWIRKEAQHNSQGLIIYTYDYTDTLAFDQSRILSFRNAMTEENIPGPAEGSYMVVAEEYSPILCEQIDFKGMFAVETRALWRLEGDFMGGSFVNYTFVDERTNKVVTIDGYIYAPNKPKRDLLIQMEAIAHSIEFAS